MQFQEFMDMMAESAEKHKELLGVGKGSEPNPQERAMWSVTSLPENKGLSFSVCLTADGDISAEQTAVTVCGEMRI